MKHWDLNREGGGYLNRHMDPQFRNIDIPIRIWPFMAISNSPPREAK
jgi:hypothetical protein